jgi:sulfur relay (sulfurtransferase) complex TusBCD TusD component (DsrE family)
VNLADNRQNIDLEYGAAPALSVLLKEFEDGGGTVLLCPHCAKAAGIDSNNLRGNAAITTMPQLVEKLKQANKVIDY